MTENEAIKNIKDILDECTESEEAVCYVTDVNAPALEMAIKALEKQIPKNPTYDGDGYAPDGMFIWDEWICPCCGRRYEVDYDDYDYCPDCGQKLDWSNEE